MNTAAANTKATGKIKARRRTTSTRIPVQRKRRRLKLRDMLFFLLIFAGIVPLIISSTMLIRDNSAVLETQKMELLTYSAQNFAKALSNRLGQSRDQLRQLGLGLLAHPDYATERKQVTWQWANDYLYSYVHDHLPELMALYATHQTDARGWGWVPRETRDERISAALDRVFKEAVEKEEPVFLFLILSDNVEDTAIAMALPVRDDNDEMIVISAVRHLNLANLTKTSDAAALEKEVLEELFLIDGEGKLLWSPGSQEEIESSLLQSGLVNDFVRFPDLKTAKKINIELGSRVLPTLARVVKVQTTGWGVVAHQPLKTALQSVNTMIQKTILVSIVLVFMALGLALVAARVLSQPIQQLVQASHQIAAGNFDRRVKTQGLGFEIADLAEDFNRMSDTVESYIEQLKKAVKQNRDLFISTIRAFAATIDAKDPYTRGHSDRVASYSRSIARYLGLPKDMQEKVWISAVLHDVGKIGIDDRVLKKVGVLTPEEFEQMKLHPVIGAEIVEPISALREMIPGIRWHHEAVNGTGYPDNLKGDEIPLMARIIGVADTFDAITTTRPYQNAYSTDYALQTIKKLTGKRFDPKIVTAFLLAFEAGHIKVEPSELTAPAEVTQEAQQQKAQQQEAQQQEITPNPPQTMPQPPITRA